MLVCCPLSGMQLEALAQGDRVQLPAFAATKLFMDAFGLGPEDAEDAERTLLYVAGLVALRDHGRRLVAVAEVVGAPDGDEWGTVVVPPISFSSVQALFADDPQAEPLVAAVRSVLPSTLDGAWSHPEHERLLEQADLMWFGPDEWTGLCNKVL